MRVLVHVCCGPCAISVLRWLQEAGHEPTGFFFNPNIQPLAEYMRRREGAIAVHKAEGVPLILADTLPWEEQAWGGALTGSFPNGTAEGVTRASCKDTSLDALPPAVHPVDWFRCMHLNEFDRCRLCWSIRLRKTAWYAAHKGYGAITSSLLYSRYQNHAVLQEQARTLSAEAGVAFVYHDFRQFWQQGIQASKALGIYRQQYCGCMWSEYARYAKEFTRSTDMAGTHSVDYPGK